MEPYQVRVPQLQQDLVLSQRRDGEAPIIIALDELLEGYRSSLSTPTGVVGPRSNSMTGPRAWVEVDSWRL